MELTKDIEIVGGAIILAIIVIGIFTVKKTVNFPPPTKVILQVPFTPQAPTDNWSRNEDCEETSIVMANAFLTGSTEDKLAETISQTAINALKKWEGANLGYNANTGADATAKMATGAFGLKVRLIFDYTETDLKTELINKHPVLLPINARLLGNPKYFDNGPLYHMIVVRGFTDKGFIVNDPGTDGGDGNMYTFAVLKNAAADWNNMTKSMEPSRKIALVMYK